MKNKQTDDGALCFSPNTKQNLKAVKKLQQETHRNNSRHKHWDCRTKHWRKNMHCGSSVYRQVMRNDHQCGHKKYCPTQTVPNFGWCTVGLFSPLHNSTTQQSAVHCDVYSQPVPSNFPTYRDETGRKDEAFFGLVGMLASEAMLASVAIKRLMDVRCCVQQVHGAWHPLTDIGPFT